MILWERMIDDVCAGFFVYSVECAVDLLGKKLVLVCVYAGFGVAKT